MPDYPQNSLLSNEKKLVLLDAPKTLFVHRHDRKTASFSIDIDSEFQTFGDLADLAVTHHTTALVSVLEAEILFKAAQVGITLLKKPQVTVLSIGRLQFLEWMKIYRAETRPILGETAAQKAHVVSACVFRMRHCDPKFQLRVVAGDVRG